MPSVRVRDWRNVTPRALEDAWAAILEDAPSFDLAQVYWPFWFAKLTQWMPRVR